MHAEITNTPGGIPTIKIDGHDIAAAVYGYRLEHDVDDFAPVLTVKLPIDELTNWTGDVRRLCIPDTTRNLLIEHGWTPPTEVDQ